MECELCASNKHTPQYVLQVVEEALVLLDKLGLQYEEEHAKDLKDTVYYLPHEVRVCVRFVFLFVLVGKWVGVHLHVCASVCVCTCVCLAMTCGLCACQILI